MVREEALAGVYMPWAPYPVTSLAHPRAPLDLVCELVRDLPQNGRAQAQALHHGSHLRQKAFSCIPLVIGKQFEYSPSAGVGIDG